MFAGFLPRCRHCILCSDYIHPFVYIASQVFQAYLPLFCMCWFALKHYRFVLTVPYACNGTSPITAPDLPIFSLCVCGVCGTNAQLFPGLACACSVCFDRSLLQVSFVSVLFRQCLVLSCVLLRLSVFGASPSRLHPFAPLLMLAVGP